ncbi:MAG: flagellar assembly protein FliW [Acidobacteria bacterium]|nr:flagellar assembly protein FliW [Acidobacteriota bacterium]
MKAMQAVDQILDQTTQLKLKSKDAIIHFEEGLIGFSDFKDFVLMENEAISPFRLLQSVESPEVGFLVLDPRTLVNNYLDLVPAREWESLGTTRKTKLLAFVICVIGSTPETSTGNFQAPLLINYEKMVGKQVILTDSGLSVRQPLL